MTAASTAIRSLAVLEANVNVKVKPAEIAAIDPIATKAEPRSANATSRTTKQDTELSRRIVAPILGLLIFILLWGGGGASWPELAWACENVAVRGRGLQ